MVKLTLILSNPISVIQLNSYEHTTLFLKYTKFFENENFLRDQL